MTDRKPQGMSFRSWIDQQISDATERGAFDNLSGTGKPLPGRGERDDPEAWVIDWVRREGVSTEEMLPTPLRLRKQSARLAESVADLGSEHEVREAVGELNERIMAWRKLPIGPPIFVPLIDSEAMVRKWRDAQPESPSGAETVPTDTGRADTVLAETGHWRRWWRRR
jgi:Domain of unknown function (DUF1992)